ncbi:DNA cytosine methyltransferase [Marinobacter hydrocarbonoclasticus]|nr:DNA cytosine methyltransferase [Marinobacter nauticus]
MKFIDLFSGCGGLSLGLLNAGHTGLFAIERSPDAFATLERNLVKQEFVQLKGHYEWPKNLDCKNHDILARLNNSDFLNYLDELGRKQDVDLVVGGPPCQGFSSAGKRDPNDPRNQLAFAYLQIVERVKPKYILMENVKGITHTFSKAEEGTIPVSEQIERTLAELGYVPFHFIENSCQWGVPQSRSRFVLLAARKDLFGLDWGSETSIEALLEHGKKLAPEVEMRVKKFAENFMKQKGLIETVTCRDALEDLKTTSSSSKIPLLVDVPKEDSPKGKFMQIPAYKVPENGGSSYQKLMKEGWENRTLPNFGLRLPNHTTKVKNRFESILIHIEAEGMIKRFNLARGKTLPILYRKEILKSQKHSLTVLDPKKPSGTVTTLPDDMLHYDEPRILTVREMARLQSFPDWFHFEGPYTTGGNLRKITCPKYTQVGNAVPPLMAEGLGLFIVKELPTLISKHSLQRNKQVTEPEIAQLIC